MSDISDYLGWVYDMIAAIAAFFAGF